MEKEIEIKLSNLKTFIFDMDGTLLNEKKEVSQANIEAIQFLHSQNIQTIIATGRPWYFAKQEMELLSKQAPIISCNGALVYDPQLQKNIFVNPINKKIAKDILLNMLNDGNYTFLIYTTNQMFYFAKPNSKWINWIKTTLEKRPETQRFDVTLIDDQFNIDGHDVVKFLLVDEEGSTSSNNIKEQFEHHQNIYFLKSQKMVLDIMPVNSDKGTGIAMLEEKGYVNYESSISFGDEVNDAPMFKRTKYSVAMGQATDSIKKQATFVTKSNEEDGVAHFINSLKK